MELTLTSPNWYGNGQTFIRGYCYDKSNTLLQGDSLIAFFNEVSSETMFKSKLAQANGLFSVVIYKDEFKAAAVDATRIYPIYYTNNGELSDNPHTFAEKEIACNKIVDFYDATGATPEGYTLIDNVFQLKPSHYAVWHPQKGVVQKPYRTYFCKKSEEKPCSGRQLAEVLDAVAERLVRSCAGRQVAIPLSGGYDSRLIAVMLKKHGYDNLLAYTVGKTGSAECRTAEQVAQKIGIKHCNIDISSINNVQFCYADKSEFERYYRFMGNYSNFTWMFEYAAIKKLRMMGCLQADTVFVPGHSGDFLAGSHITKAGVTDKDTACSLARKIMYISNESGYRRSIHKDVLDYFQTLIAEGVTPYSAYQGFILQNRQAHNIINSARVYEFFGYDVRLPLWDTQLTELFRFLPLEQLQNCSLYNAALMTIFGQNSVAFAKKEVAYKPKIKILKGFVKRFVPVEYFKPSQKGESGEWELCQPLLEEMLANATCRSFWKPANSNAIMKRWYLMKIREGKG